MRVSALSVALILLLAVISCKKDSAFPFTKSAVYYKNGVAEVSQPRLFALSGEIKNTALLQKFENYDDNWVDAEIEQLFPYTGRIDSIGVLNENQIDVNDGNQYRPYAVSRKGNLMTLTGKDTIRSTSSNEVFTRTIPYYVGLYKPPVFSETLVSSTRGYYLFEYTTLKQFFLEAENGTPRVPWLICMVHQADGSIYPVPVQNKLDINFYKNLSPGDTILVREYVVSYKK